MMDVSPRVAELAKELVPGWTAEVRPIWTGDYFFLAGMRYAVREAGDDPEGIQEVIAPFPWEAA